MTEQKLNPGMEWDLGWVDEAWCRAEAKIGRSARTIGAAFPNGTKDGRYVRGPEHDWVAGFWPGLLWLAYRENGDEELRRVAEACERQLADTLQTYDLLHHDVGFMFSLSSVAQHRLSEASGRGADEGAKRHALIAANLLAGRYNPQGEFIRAWPNWDEEDHTGWAIIDCLMNLPLLHWAGREIKDPRYKHIAIRHADSVLRDFLRPDGSVCHIFRYDPETGEPIEALAGQGYAADSAWARGASWALYGFALSYRYTGEARYREAALRVARFFVARLPEDAVPYWDFFLPEAGRELMPRDSSAAAIAASGLLELADLLKAGDVAAVEDAAWCRISAERIVWSLCDRYGQWGDEHEGLLRHATGYYSRGVYVDESLIYGDYFFVEALAKLRGRKELFW
ncbi:glycoside hydrolase family 88 protein [Paenibacillus glycanilyticus]|uniref:glycoside hydrolase family 88 protein n=1 Tax=Paenibacillus glycanilyticus TaxID=126569 RepID=UPI00203EF5D7|nr:glycoside hydrolase family 88 protein [Paenibacillus glycanilyticus]MCM3629152.1 glycoside hydrolase family 88 protein [Paenibacillus glycanilyticus]